MNRTLLALVLMLAASPLLATDVTADITSDTTWNNAGSPYRLRGTGFVGGGDIKIRNGATLTIDSSAGSVDVEWTGGSFGDQDLDLIVGDGASEQGSLVISASSGDVTFKIATGSNIRIKNNGQLRWSSTTATTTFTRYDGSNTWGALIFESDQSRQSEVKKSTLSYGGNDSKTALIVVDDSETYVPQLENLTFSNQATSGVAAIRMNGKGINTLKEGNVVTPFSVSSIDFVFYINAVTSTASTIRFPDIDTPDSPSSYLAGTCTVGDSSNVSHWRFDDGYTFKCAASSKITVANGSIRGTEETRPTFEANTGTSFTHWVGLEDASTSKSNVFGGFGPYAFVTVRNASTGVDINKGASYVPESGEKTAWRFPGLIIKKCTTGLRVRTHIDTGSDDAGYTTIIEGADIGDSGTSDECNTACVTLDYGRVILESCQIKGAVTRGVGIGTVAATNTYDVAFQNCRITDSNTAQAVSTGILVDSSQGAGAVEITRTIVAGYSQGVEFAQVSTGGYTPNRSLTISHCFLSAKSAGSGLGRAITARSLGVNIQTAAVCTITVENCTISGVAGGFTNNGILLLELRSGSSFSCVRTTIDGNTDHGVYVTSAANNTCEYTFLECSITGNGGSANEGGIHDARTQNAKVVATRCTIANNSPYNAYDADNTALMDAEDCYWGSDAGPGATINANVDGAPFLERPYIGWLIGGSPAGVSSLRVENGGPSFPDQFHIIDTDTLNVHWTVASDFAGQSQSAYELDLDDDPAFGSLTYDGSKQASVAESGESLTTTIAPTLAAGVIYHVRIRVWDANDRFGPWYYHTFRTNSAPATIGNTSRSPGDDQTPYPILSDRTPVFIWEAAADAEEDPLHFEVEVTVDVGASTDTYIASSKDATSFYAGVYLDWRNQFQVSTDDGNTWQPMPADGAPSGGTLIRLTWPDAWALPDNGVEDPLEWVVRAFDGFELGADSSTWYFEMDRSYTISGQLLDAMGDGINSRTVRLYINGEDSGDTDDTATDVVNGRFDIVTDDPLEVGDVLWLYVDNETEKAAAVLHFTGQDIPYVVAGVNNVVLRESRLYVYGTVTALTFTNPDFEIHDADGDIPWTYAGGGITLLSSLEGSGDGVHVHGSWHIGDIVDGTTSLDVELTVAASGSLRVTGVPGSSQGPSFHSLTNDGTIEIESGAQLTLDGANSVTNGSLAVRDSTLVLKKSGGLSLTIASGVCELTRAQLGVDGTDPGSLIVDSASSDMAVLNCEGSTFSEVGLVVEPDGVVASFNNNTFADGISTRHIHWKTTNPNSARVMRGIQFDYALTQGSEFNVEADASAIALHMLGCGGVRWGEGYDKNGGSEGDALDDLVLWELTPPTNLKITVGDTRLRLEWTASDQADLASAGYNVYRTTNPADSVPWGSPLNGGTPVTDIFYNDASLTNGTVYYYYVTAVDSGPTPDAESVGSNRVNSAPGSSQIDELAPSESPATGILALTVLGERTHWESSTTVTITKGGGSGVTVNDTLVISAGLVLVDATLSGATTGTWTVTATENDVWGIGAYDEVESADLTVNADDPDESDRPTLVFSTNNSGIAADANTSGAFVLNIDFTDNGGGIDSSSLEIFTSRDIDAYFGGASSPISAGTELRGAGVAIESLDDIDASWTIEQIQTTNGDEEFADGEYTVYARVADDQGNYSDWATRRFYVEGAAADVATTTTLLYQGDIAVNVVITGTFSTTVDGVDFGTGITTVSYNKDSGTQVTATVTVDETAVCGPRTFTVDMTTGSDPAGIVLVEYPTNILPVVNNDEPSRNPAVGGLSVFLVNGEFFKGETDIATRGRMMGMSWSRFYRSQIAYNGPLGHGWIGHYFQRAFVDSGSSDIHWYTPDGRKEVFPDVSGGYSSPAGVYVRAESESTHDTVTLTDRHGYRCVFNSEGRLWKCIDRNGNATECSYSYLGQLATITDDRGASWEIEYFDHGRVYKVIDKVWDTSTPREIEYAYDANGDLTEQKAPATARYDGTPLARITYGYGYDSEHRMTKCINPREFAESANPVPYLENFYDSTGRVVDQKLGNEGDVQDGHVARSAFIRLRYESATLIHELDRAGHRTDYTIDGSGRTTDVKRYTAFWSVDTDQPYDHSTVNQEVAKLRTGDPSYFQTVLTYNSNHEVLTTTHPRGNVVTYTYPDTTQQTSGTATSAPSALVLTDNSKSWTADAYIGMTLRVGSDAGEYRYYPIADNDATTITIASPGYSLSGDGWGSGEDYSVTADSGDALAAGNVLTVARSDESLGSASDIVTTYTYEPRYQLVKTVTDAIGNTSTYTYDYEESEANDAGASNLVTVASPVVTGSMPSATITSRTTYNEYGQPIAMVDGEGNVSRLLYYGSGDNEGFLQQRITAWGEFNLTSEYAYDRVGNLTGSWPPRAFDAGVTKDHFKTTYEVNELNQTWHVTSPKLTDASGGQVDSYSYFDANGNLTHSFREYITWDHNGKTNPSGGNELDPDWFDGQKASTPMAATWHETQYRYNLLNYQTESEVDAVAGSAITTYTTRVRYDANYNTIESITPLGNRSRTIYDERDMTYRRIAGADSDVAGIYESSYDENGNVSISLDARGNATTYEYDGFDRNIKVTDAAGHYRTTTYDANSNVTETKAFDSAGVLLAHSVTTYDTINRAYATARLANNYLEQPIGDGWARTTSVFDHNSRVVSTTDDNGVTHSTTYDGANRVLETVDAVGNRTRYTYNLNGATSKVDYFEVNRLNGATEKSHVEYIRDYADRVTEFRDRRWSSSFDTSGSTTYDYWGRTVTSTDPAGNSATTVYDLLSRVTESTQEAGTDDIHTLFVYDDDSRTVTRGIKRNPGDTTYQETNYVHDERNRLVTLRRPDLDIWTYTYDANGNQLGWTDPLGTEVVNTYDERNLISYRHITKGTGIRGSTYESYEFDGLGRLQSCSNYEGSELISASQWRYNTLGMAEYQAQTIGRMTPLTDYGDRTTLEVRAEYDATGFCRAVTHWNGRRVENVPDEMNRLLMVYDPAESKAVGVFTYAGSNRLVERVNGNGTAVTLSYEASGCGCGGSTPFVERVEHSRGGSVLFAIDRRFDPRGLVTAERRDTQGSLGRVYRYDAAQRLTATYYNVDLYDVTGPDDLAGFATHANTPTVFGHKVAYSLDPRGNRSGSSAVVESSDQSTTFNTDGYTVNDTTNIYETVDSQTSTFDAMEQQTEDKSTGLTIYYDYKGQKVEVDTGGDGGTLFDYDNQGKLVLEQEVLDGGGLPDEGLRASQTAFCNDIGCQSCGCSGGGGADNKLAMIRIATESDGDALITSNVLIDYGPDPSAAGSAMCYNPATAATPSGSATAMGSPFHHAGDGHELVIDRYLHNDQLGSLVGMSDASGDLLAEIDYLDYGEPVYMPVLASPPQDDITNSVYDSGNKTTLIIGIGNASWIGCELRIARPGASADRYLSCEVMNSNGNDTLVYDPNGAISGDIHTAIQDSITSGTPMAGGGPVVYDNPNGCQGEVWDSVSYDGGSDRTLLVDNHVTFNSDYVGKLLQPNIANASTVSIADWDNMTNTLHIVGDITSYVAVGDAYRVEMPDGGSGVEECNSGFWDAAPAYASGETTFTTVQTAHFRDFQAGWLLIPDVTKPAYVRIKDIDDTDDFKLTVEGDVTDLAGAGARFRVVAPVGTDQDSGEAQLDPWTKASRWLWAGYMYEPPLVGYETGTGIERKAPGPDDDPATPDANLKGQYYCWNRTYDIGTGRWTTPDPAASPVTNLQDYVGQAPSARADRSGLTDFGNRGLQEHLNDRGDLEQSTQVGREYYHADPFDKKNNNYPLNWAKHDTTAWVKVYRNKQACEITIAVPLNMEFPESLEKQKATSLMQSWRIGIRIAWDNKYRVCCGVCSECPNGWAIRIDADFSFGSAHEKNNVVVKSPSKGGRANRGKWYTNSSNRTIAHEFGHWLGLPDEYGMTKNIDGSDLYDWGSNRDKRETGLMGENKPGQQGRLKRYFEMIIGDLKGYPCGGGDQPSYWLTESSGSCDR